MLTKEYRICLPMSVQEYRIAQLYMIQRKSREESSGSGSGVEILINEPYTDGPGGSGQYTHKIYHIGSHLPGWFRAILPKSALRVEEEAWNAYPYTRTIYRCPFIEKFSLEIETRYLDDGGEVENLFDLSPADLRGRVVDFLDIVKDPISSGDYRKEEDPKLFVSDKRPDRGPLEENWRQTYTQACKDPANTSRAIMCAYKLCKVEFRYWGMQSKIERFIHDIGLRKTMLRAHRQAWAWQDEYFGLTLDDIRRLELETQLALQEKMAAAAELEEESSSSTDSRRHHGSPKKRKPASPSKSDHGSKLAFPSSDSGSRENVKALTSTGSSPASLQSQQNLEVTSSAAAASNGKREPRGAAGSPANIRRLEGSPHRGRHARSRESAAWRVGSFEQLGTGSEDDDEFFDAQEDLYSVDSFTSASASLFRSSSMELITQGDEYSDPPTASRDAPGHYRGTDDAVGSMSSPFNRRLESFKSAHGGSLSGPEPSPTPSTGASQSSTCKTTLLFMVLHGGSVMDSGHEYQLPKHSDIATLRATLDAVVRAHYPTIQSHVAIRAVHCPAICGEALSLLASINPYSFDSQTPMLDTGSVVANTNFPLAAIPLFASGAPVYCDLVQQVVHRANHVYGDFLHSEEGLGFNGQVCLLSDSMGSIIAYDALCKNNPYLQAHLNQDNGRQSSPDDVTSGSGQSSRPVRQHHHSARDHTHQAQPGSNLETIKQHSHSNPDLTVTDLTGPSEGSEDASGDPGPVVNGPGPQDSARLTHPRQVVRYSSCPTSRRTSTGSQSDMGRFDFEVSDFFMFGSPIGLIMAYRKTCFAEDKMNIVPRPSCHQMYNLFYPSDPCAIRIEPLLHERFKQIPPMKIPRYQKFPLGDGQSIHVVETLQSNADIWMEPPGSSHSHETPSFERRHSNMSTCSQISGHGEMTAANVSVLTSKWWGNKRLDYALYYPDALQSFPSAALPYLLHSSFWESTDVVAFILRQVVRQDTVMSSAEPQKEGGLFKPEQPREKWMKRRTTIKLRNVAPNHRANDVIVLEDRPQILIGRFMYGPLDMVSLSGEKVDVHIMTQPPGGEWKFFGTGVTDNNGRLTFRIPDEKKLSQGMYPVKAVVRGDHTSVDLFLTVLPPKTETVVFSIDGSFTASVSIMAKDPKVRPGAVDVVRHWQELGYLILYVTARPDMQQKKVVAWLAQHNFPHGMVAFMDGLSADPLRQKANYLKQLVQEAQIQIQVAYGSTKDVSVYQMVGLQPNQSYIVGKVSKKNQKDAMVISGGYAVHLTDLVTHGMSRPAVGNARMFLRKSCFSLPGQHSSSGKKPVRKTASLPHRGAPSRESSHSAGPSIAVSESGNTVVDAGVAGPGAAVRARGVSPRGKTVVTRYDSSNA